MTFPSFSWPDWRKAPPGTRFRHIRTGHTGTLIAPSKNKHNGAIVRWDPIPGNPIQPKDRATFVGIAVDAVPIEDNEDA